MPRGYSQAMETEDASEFEAGGSDGFAGGAEPIGAQSAHGGKFLK